MFGLDSRRAVIIACLIGAAFGPATSPAAETKWQSHPPTRPLPQAADRPLPEGATLRFVAPDGDDAGDGTQQRPWRTVAFAVTKLQPGDTLVLRGGIYHEHVTATLVGTLERPITLRSHPGELAILDGGMPEFLESPATAWEPCPDGVAGEFRSTKTYRALEQKEGENRVSLLGNFADSMTPLQGYWNRGDLQSDNPYWTLKDGGKVGADQHVYCGPGVWYDVATGRIHCRLAHTKLPGLGDDNYRGETDPRKVPLVLAAYGAGSVLRLEDCRHVRLQDLVLRGARQPTLWIDGGANLELDGVTAYGGGACMKVDGVRGFRMAHSACRGLAAPWTFRGSLKYRSIESRLFTTAGWDPTGDDGREYDIQHCEFTDSVDGVFIGNVAQVVFRRNLVENVSDDGVFLTAPTGYDGQTPGGGCRIEQNRFARILTAFAFGVGHGRQRIVKDGPPGRWGAKQVGQPTVIAYNVFDFRRPVMYHWPSGPDDAQEITFLGRFAGDHGSPGWEPMQIVQNTIIAGDPPRYEYGTDGFSRAVTDGTSRLVCNNIVVQLRGLPGQYLPEGRCRYFADCNLLWSASEGSTNAALPKPRYPRDYVPPKAEWGAHDVYADPKFTAFDADWRKPVDLRLRDGSPARGVGRDVSSVTGRADDKPDLGALALGNRVWSVGVRGRLDVCGNPRPAEPVGEVAPWSFRWESDKVPPVAAARAVVVTGYPAFDAPLVAFALRKGGLKVVEVDRAWLDPREFAKYRVVVVDGSFARARVTPTAFADDELPIVRQYLEAGGTLWLFRDRFDVFATDAGRKALAELVGPQQRDTSVDYGVRLPQHPWVAHLAEAGADVSWLAKQSGGLHVERGEAIISTSSGKAILARVKVGRGQLIYTGWSPAASLPGGRNPATTVADERRFDDQMRVITNVVEGLGSAAD